MANYPFILNGTAYTEGSFLDFGYVTALPNALGDLVREMLLQHSSTSASSVTIGTGAKSLTAQPGKAFRQGDSIFIASSANPANRMFGSVTSYNFSSGALNVNVLGTSGSGTLSSWNIGLGGVPSSQLNDNQLTLDNGGTGFRSSSFAQSGAFIYATDPSMGMCEIYDDFAGSQGGLSLLDSTGTFSPPWYGTGNTVQPNDNANTDCSTGAGYVTLKPSSATLSSLTSPSAILAYGETGFLHGGRGAMIFESNMYNTAGTGVYSFKLGLACQPRNVLRDIFSAGGIGFEANSSVNGGRYVIVCGYPGNMKRLNTGFVPSAGIDSFRIEVDHDGINADFYINNNYCGQLSNSVPTTGSQTLMQPAFEAAIAPATATQIWIDSIWTRKYLLR